MTTVFLDFLSLSKQVQEQYFTLGQDRFHTISTIGISIFHTKLLIDHCDFRLSIQLKTAKKFLSY